MKIFLIGFMASGKSTVGYRLARRLSLPFVDLDMEIVRQAGRSIVEIFARHGEEEFRRMEAEALAEVVRAPPAVVATGGGLASQPGALEVMETAGLTVWLAPELETILRRLAEDDDARPLARGSQALQELFEARQPDYRRARLRIDISASEHVDQVVQRIVEAIEDLPCAT